MKALPKIIAIVGTTASGKSDLAIELAKDFNGEIISVDSRQIYKEMNIGTNKEPGKTVRRDDLIKRSGGLLDAPVMLSDVLNNYYEVKGVPHYLIDVVKPYQVLTLAHIQLLAFGIIEDILERGKIPILVGGTGLYTSAIVENWKIPAVEPNKNLRHELDQLTDVQLIKRLNEVDGKQTETIDLENRRRLIRAIEIASQDRMIKSTRKLEPKFQILYIAPKMEKETVYARCDQRVDLMIDRGLVEEVKNIVEQYGADTVSMTGIGYKQVVQYLKGEWSLEQAIEEIKKATRRYVKRQITWWKKHGNVNWVQRTDEARALVKNFLK